MVIAVVAIVFPLFAPAPGRLAGEVPTFICRRDRLITT
jgi:hypothetical protein